MRARAGQVKGMRISAIHTARRGRRGTGCSASRGSTAERSWRHIVDLQAPGTGAASEVQSWARLGCPSTA